MCVCVCVCVGVCVWLCVGGYMFASCLRCLATTGPSLVGKEIISCQVSGFLLLLATFYNSLDDIIYL